MTTTNDDLPQATRKRLIQLEELLKSWSEEKITSARICELTGWKDSLVRHDLFLIEQSVKNRAERGDLGLSTNFTRGWKNGYKVSDLLAKIHSINKSETQNICIVGLGVNPFLQSLPVITRIY